MEIDNKNIMNRLKRTEGQIRGIQKMIDEDKECMDVITQLSAVRSSIDRVMGMIVAEISRIVWNTLRIVQRSKQKKWNKQSI